MRLCAGSWFLFTAGGWIAAAAPDAVSVRQTMLRVLHVDYEFAVELGENHVPKMNWTKFRSRPEHLVESQKPAVILENRFIRATFLTEHGLLYSFIHKPSGREQMWINPAARPIAAHNDTGFWITWGGSENVLPRGEHGTSHALQWNHRVASTRGGGKTIEMRSKEPLTSLEHLLRYTLYPDYNFLEIQISIHNPGSEPVRFSHWTNNMFAPGGLGEITARTEFIVPAARFVPSDKPFNRWMMPLLGPPHESPLRFAGNWRDIGDLMTTGLTQPFFGAYSPEARQAIMRTVDLKYVVGFNIWTWGFPLSERRQREFTAKPPNNGYVEMWSGTVKDYSDAALGTIGPGSRISWEERLCVVHAPDPSLLYRPVRLPCFN